MVIIEKDCNKLTLVVISMRSLGQFLFFYFFYDKVSQVQKALKSNKKH